MNSVLLRSAFLAVLPALLFFTPPSLAQPDPDLSVHATADSLIITIGSETVVVPRDALALLASPDGYTQEALSAHIALLHGTLTINDEGESPLPGEDEDSPTNPTIPILTTSSPLMLDAGTAERSTGSEGHAWEDALLDGHPVVQHLPDIDTRYGTSGGPRLTWEVEATTTGNYFFYVQSAGISHGNTVWAGTPDHVKRVTFGTNQELQWTRVGPITLESGPGEIEVRGREDGAYFAALVVSTRRDLSHSDLDTALADGANPRTASSGLSDGAAQRASSGGTPIPDAFALHPVYPNPTRSETTARIDLPEAAEVRLEVFDTLGRRVEEQRASLEAGFGHALSIGTAALASGVYVVRVTARSPTGDTMGARRLTVLR